MSTSPVGSVRTKWPRRCSANPALPAAALCTSCGEPFNGKFLAVRADGRAICHRCAAEEQVELLTPAQHDDGDPVLADGWRRAFMQIVLQPHVIFSSPYHGRIMPAIRFGYACTLLGMVLWLGWAFLLDYDGLMEAMMEAAREAGPPYVETLGDNPERSLQHVLWLSLPIVAALRLVVGIIAFHLGARLVGAGPNTFDEHARVFSLASVALLFCIIPEFGTFIAMVVWLSTSLAYLRQRHALGTIRALIALLPAVLILSLLWPAPS